jgi:RHS repeat-associated protein
VFWRRYQYDGRARVTSVTHTGSSVWFDGRTYSWSGDGTLTTLGLNGNNTTFGYNNDLRRESTTLPGTSHTITQEFSMVHSPIERASVALDVKYRFDVTRRLDLAFHEAIPRLDRYFYDGLGRLDSVRFISEGIVGLYCYDVHWDDGWTCYGGTLDSTRAFQYDSVGNRTDLSGDYMSGNRITYFDGCDYETDYDGNVTSRSCSGQTVTFTWNALNQLVSYTVNDSTVNLRYDAFGRLVRQWGTPVTENLYLWDRGHLYATLNSTLNIALGQYSYYPGTDRPHATVVNSTQYFAHQDGLGNVKALTTSDKTIQRTYEYDEWGQLTGGTDNIAYAHRDRVRFKGALWFGDAGVELYYMRNRWYEPKTGRFLSEDPAGALGGLNRYAFAGDNPIGLRDALGLSPSSEPAVDGDEHDHSNAFCENGGVYDIDFGKCWGWDGHLHDPDDPTGMAPHWVFHSSVFTEAMETVGRLLFGGQYIGVMEELPGVRVRVYQQPNLYGAFGACPQFPCGITMGNAIWVTDAKDPVIVHHEMWHVRQIQRDGAANFYGRWLTDYYGKGCIPYEREAYASHGDTRCR